VNTSSGNTNSGKSKNNTISFNNLLSNIKNNSNKKSTT
jgi:hypothetical protein